MAEQRPTAIGSRTRGGCSARPAGRSGRAYRPTKRVLDVVGALAALIVLSPVLGLVAVLVVTQCGKPVLYRGERMGLEGKPFHILKFRTMVPDAERLGTSTTALHDSRLTRIGSVLRKYKIDELPQLLNVISGDMSLVGPRPQVERYTRLYSDSDKEMLSVRPGITDYASIRFVNLDQLMGDSDVDQKYRTEIEPEKNRLRLKYVREMSFHTDLRILILTAMQMLRIRRIWNIDN